MGRFHLSMTAAIVAATAILAAQPVPGFLARPADQAIRLLTWNVYRNSVFPPKGELVDVAAATRPAQFARILRAVRPDVVCLQEVTESIDRSVALVTHILPLPEGQAWQAHAAVDTVIVSRYRLGARAGGQLEGDRQRGHSIALIKAPTTDLLVICSHFQSSADLAAEAMRRRQAQVITDTIRDAQAGRGPIPLPARTPFIVLGDFNAIPGATLFVDALVSGRPVYAATESAEGLDWDRSSLTDAQPRHNASGSERYTWRNDLDRFQPGMLDRILYSDSVLASVNQFVLDTTAMSYDELVRAQLRAIDVMLDPQTGVHDHFPLVIDTVLWQDPERR